MNYVQRAINEGLLIQGIDGFWNTPYGRYKFIKNACRYLKKNGHKLERKHDFNLGVIYLTLESKPFLLNLRIGKR